MSFAYDVKEELCRGKRKYRRCCALAEAYGILLFSSSLRPNRAKMTSEHIYLVARFVQIIEQETGIALGIDNREGSGSYTITIEERPLQVILGQIGVQPFENGLRLHIDRSPLGQDHCRAAFVRGAFLQCGTLMDPQRGYHLEMVTTHRQLGEDLRALLEEMGIPARMVQRKNSHVVYVKGSEAIEDMLSLMGATQSVLQFMEIKVMRDVRGRVNRKVNCETANMARTAAAAVRQLHAIQTICAVQGMESLDDGLRQVAQLRMEYPEMSLKEIGQQCDPPISRHGVNHRMNRLLQMAQEAQRMIQPEEGTL